MSYVKNWDEVKNSAKKNSNSIGLYREQNANSGGTAGQTAQANGIAGNAPKQTVYGSTPTAVRDTMVNQYGLDNNKIGWDGTNVLYDGNVFLKPDYVDDNGVSFASGNSIYNAVANLGANGQTAVRSGLGRYGLDMNELGMTNGHVTYNGKAYMTPDRVENGVSYVDNPNDLMNMAMQVYRDNGQDIVRLTDYVANTQLPFSVNYENGMVSVGGQMIKPAFVTPDGKAYVDRGALDAAVAKAQEAAGIQNRQDIYAKYDDRYGDMYADLVDRLYNREEFSYNPETDPAYEAYRDMYMREGDRAMRDAMGAAMGASGGYMNSAAATAAAQQNNYYTQQLNDRIPELMQFAYQRYADDFTRNRQALSDIMGLDKEQFNREYGMNNDIINDIRYNNALNEARDDKAYERYWSEKAYNDSIDQWNKTFNETQLNNQLAREAQQIANLSARRVEALRQAQATGQWPAEAAELGFDINSDPFAMDIRQLEMERDNAIQLQQALSDINVAAEKELGAFNTQQQKELAAYNSGLDWNLYQNKYNLESQNTGLSNSDIVKMTDTMAKNINGIYKSNDTGKASGQDVILIDGNGNYRINPEVDRASYLDLIINNVLENNAMPDEVKGAFLNSLGISDSDIIRVADYMGYS